METTTSSTGALIDFIARKKSVVSAMLGLSLGSGKHKVVRVSPHSGVEYKCEVQL